MKKIIAAVIAVLMLCACSAEPPKTSERLITDGFLADVEIKYGTLEATAQLEKQNDNYISLTLSQPAALSGMRFEYENGSFSCSYKGIEMDFDNTDETAMSVGGAVIDVINQLCSGELEGANNDGVVEFSGNSIAGEFFAVIDPDSGAVKSIKIPSKQLECVFSSR